MTFDPIYPEHYKEGRKYEPIEVIEDWQLNYNLGNALKYIARNGRKTGENPIEGLRKAIFYLDREIQKLEKKEAKFTAKYNGIIKFSEWHTQPTDDFIGQAEWDSLCDI